MIYDRHEDLAATTKRHPAVVTHRTGVKLDGTLVAQDIEVVMDGGAYCTLTPVVLSRGALHAGGPYRCPNVRIRARATRTNTPPNGAFRGFGAPQTEFAAEVQLGRIAEALGDQPARDPAPEPLPARATRRRPGRSSARASPPRRSSSGPPRRPSSRGSRRAPAEGPGPREPARATSRARRSGPARDRTASGIGVALAWHGAGFTGSGEVKLASVASIELGVDGRVRILTGSTEMGQGTKTIFPQLVAAELGLAYDDVDMAPQDTAARARFGAHGRQPDGDGRRRPAHRRPPAGCGPTVEERNGGRPFADVRVADAAAHGPTRIDQQFEPYPHVHFDDETYRGDAYPAFGWAACVATVDVDLDSGEVTVRDVVAADDVGPGHPPGPRRGPGRGRHAPGDRLRDGRGDQASRRPLPERPARHLHHPDRARRAADPRDPRRGAVRAARRTAPRGSASCRWTSGAPAVVAAIHDATGAWIHELPASPERILAAPRRDAGGRRPGSPQRDRRGHDARPSRTRSTPRSRRRSEAGTDPRPDAARIATRSPDPRAARATDERRR